jgi:hypothetical protein
MIPESKLDPTQPWSLAKGSQKKLFQTDFVRD